MDASIKYTVTASTTQQDRYTSLPYG